MASGFTNFCMNLLLEKLLRGTAGSFPGTVYIGLSSTVPTDTGANVTEPTGVGGYARQAITVTGASWAALVNGATTNAAIINFGTASGNIGVMTDWVMFDALTTGNLLMWADLNPSQNITSGNPYSFAIGALGVAGI